MTVEQIERTFQYHAPFGTQTERYAQIRAKAKELALVIHDCTAPISSRERALAFTALQQAVMWANAAIAINEHSGPSGTVIGEL